MSLNVSLNSATIRVFEQDSESRQRFLLTRNDEKYHGRLIPIDQIPLNELVVIRNQEHGWTGCITSLTDTTAEFHHDETCKQFSIDLNKFDVLRLEF